MRKKPSLTARAIELFKAEGLTNVTINRFDAEALLAAASNVRVQLIVEYGGLEVERFLASVFADGGLASIMGCGRRAQHRMHGKRL